MRRWPARAPARSLRPARRRHGDRGRTGLSRGRSEKSNVRLTPLDSVHIRSCGQL
jgi:hypothetical protein